MMKESGLLPKVRKRILCSVGRCSVAVNMANLSDASTAPPSLFLEEYNPRNLMKGMHTSCEVPAYLEHTEH